jgi:hypothetical protein
MLTTTTARPPQAPRPYRVILSLPDGGSPIGLNLYASSAAEAVMSGLELAGPGARVIRVTQQGEW